MWKRADERFFWNRYLMGKMIDLTENGGVDVSGSRRSVISADWCRLQLSRFILPILYGCMSSVTSSFNMG